MLTLFISIFEAILLGIVLASLSSRIGLWLAQKLGLMDIPGKLPHKQHQHPVPLAGGFTAFPVILLGFLLFRSDLDRLWVLVFPVTIVFFTGLLDDRRPVPFVVKLLGQTIAAGVMVYLGFNVSFLGPERFPFLKGLLPAINAGITIVWLVGTTNAFNFVDSMDGLATGTAAIVGSFLAAASMFTGQMALARLMGLVVGICLVLYYLNVTPARLFLGDSGALTIGFLLASGAMIFSPKGYLQASSWFIPVMILGLPLFDMTLVVFSRLRRSRPIYQADRGHTYHRLVAAGFSPNRAIVLLHLSSVVLGCLSFLAIQFPPVWANLVFVGTLAMAVALILYLDHPSRWL